MSNSTILECGCEIYEEDNDWGENRKYTKKFCQECKTLIDTKITMLENNKNEILEQYKLTPTNDLVNDLFDIQTNILKKDERMSYRGYCQSKIYCLCCNTNIQFNNLNKHIKSLGHVNKLPIKYDTLINDAINNNKFNKQQKEINRFIKK